MVPALIEVSNNVETVVERLEDEVESDVYAFNMAGYNPSTETLEAEFSDALELLEENDYDETAFVGHSRSGIDIANFVSRNDEITGPGVMLAPCIGGSYLGDFFRPFADRRFTSQEGIFEQLHENQELSQDLHVFYGGKDPVYAENVPDKYVMEFATVEKIPDADHKTIKSEAERYSQPLRSWESHYN